MEVRILDVIKKLAHDVDLDHFTTEYCCRRLKSEGIKFLTVTLPTLDAALLRGLEEGFLDRTFVHSTGLSLTCVAWKRKSLRYFSKFLNEIFDCNTGLLLDSPDALSIYCLRQFCAFAYKLALPFNEDVVEAAEKKFTQTDAGLNETIDWFFVDNLRKDFETYFKETANKDINSILAENRPRSSKGTFAFHKQYTVKNGVQWYARKTLPFDLDAMTRNGKLNAMTGYKKPYPAVKINDLYSQKGTEDAQKLSELLFVPKDSRGPRTIVREPYEALAFQMSFNTFLSNELTRVTEGRVNFQDQLINRELARTSSLDRRWATLDLSDASDRVSHKVMSRIFQHSPGLRWFLSNTRSTHCCLPNGEIIPLNKLAGMGSGLTFPSMSLLIYLASVRALTNALPLTYKQAMKLVYVYGDDIICKTNHMTIITQSLQRVGLMVNVKKSFRKGSFRESCGGDYFKGENVTPIRCKLSSCELSFNQSKMVLSIQGDFRWLQTERFARELVKGGLVATAEVFYASIEAETGPLPEVGGESPILGRYSILGIEKEMDKTGLYKKYRCLISVPRRDEGDCCPYVSLASKLQRVKKLNLLDELLYGSTTQVHQNEVDIPRSVSYRRVYVSGFRLMG